MAYRRLPSSSTPSEHGGYGVQTSSKSLPSIDHGELITTVVVGRGKHAKNFAIHRQLLRNESPKFDRLLSEERQDVVHLEDECPIAFAVVYHYLYSGSIWEVNFYPNKKDEDDAFWFRAYKASTALEMKELQTLIFAVIVVCLWGSQGTRLPSNGFVSLLFDGKEGHFQHVRDFIIDVSGYSFVTGNLESKFTLARWINRLEGNESYAAAVMIRVCQLKALGPDSWTFKPEKDPKYAVYIVAGAIDGTDTSNDSDGDDDGDDDDDDDDDSDDSSQLSVSDEKQDDCPL